MWWITLKWGPRPKQSVPQVLRRVLFSSCIAVDFAEGLLEAKSDGFQTGIDGLRSALPIDHVVNLIAVLRIAHI